MLYQIHQQSITDREDTTMLMQGSAETQHELRTLVRDALKEFPLAENSGWLVVPEGDKKFVMTCEQSEQETV